MKTRKLPALALLAAALAIGCGRSPAHQAHEFEELRSRGGARASAPAFAAVRTEAGFPAPEPARAWAGAGIEAHAAPMAFRNIGAPDGAGAPAAMPPEDFQAPPLGAGGGHEGGFGGADPAQRMLARRADMRVRVECLERADGEISAMKERHGAFSSFSTASETMRRHTIRVPAETLPSFLAELAGMGRVLQRTESAEDVTLQFFDLEGRLETQRELLATFRGYLGRAASISDILAVEARIAELQRALDGTGRDLRHLDDRVSHSIVALSVEGPAPPGAFAGPGLGERIGSLLGGFGRFLSGAAVFLIGLAIYGIPILLALALLYWLLLGRIGLLKKLCRLAAGKPAGGGKAAGAGGGSAGGEAAAGGGGR